MPPMILFLRSRNRIVVRMLLIGVLIPTQSLGGEHAHLGNLNGQSFNAIDWTTYRVWKRE